MTRHVSRDVGNFAIVPEALVFSTVSDRALRMYAALARFADKEGDAYPSRATLAQRLGWSESTVDRAVKELTKKRLLRVTLRVKNADGDVRPGRPSKGQEGWEATSSLYQLVTEVPAELRIGVVRYEDTPVVTDDGTCSQNRRPIQNHLNERTTNSASSAPSELRNALWDATIEAVGEVTTQQERSRRGKCINELIAINATPHDVKERAAIYRELWPRIVLTDTGLVSRWSDCKPKRAVSEW